MAYIQSAIQSVASASGVDEHFIPAIVMQESEGCVRVPTTNNGVVNPGLMQSHMGLVPALALTLAHSPRSPR
jgi:hypothetical protein